MSKKTTRTDFTGQTLGRWTVLEYALTWESEAYWLCRCSCGQEKCVPASSLRSRPSKTCNCHNIRVTCHETAKKKLLSRVKMRADTGCWEWQGSRLPEGYGTLTWALFPKISRAHRMAYTLWKGPIPDSLLVMHKCDNPCCCNPEHLLLGTDADNNADMVGKGRNKAFKGTSHPNAKLTEQDVRDIRHLAATTYFTTRDIAEYFDVTYGAVSAILRGVTWSHLVDGEEI